MTDPNPQPLPLPSESPAKAPGWQAAGLLAGGLLAFVWVSDIQGVMFHRAEFELGDYLRPVLTYVLGAALVLWEWDRFARTFLSWRFLVVGGGLTAAIVIVSLPEAPSRPVGVPALRAGTRATLPELAHPLAAPKSIDWLEPQHIGRPESIAARMGFRERAAAPGLVADLPSGWVELPPTNMRPLNYGVTGQPQVECYVSSLPGAAGGALDNINRWRTEQMGLPPIDAAALDALPRVRLLGVDAVEVECEGTFAGIGSDPLQEARLLGVIAALPQVTVFLKMTGPRAAVDAQRAAFERVRDSLRLGAPADPHAANPHGATPNATSDDGAVQPPPASGLRWEVPTGWREAAHRQNRVVTLVPEQAPTVECYVTELGGTGGGLAMNVNRWRQDQFGAEALDAAAIAALPTVPMLGTTGTIVEVAGTFTGMRGGPQPDQGLLGVVCLLERSAVFVKMIGPRAVVQAERERFLAFCRSLRGQ